MKRLLIPALLFAALPISAQKIVIDDVQNGFRSTSTDNTVCRSTTDKMVLSVGLSSIISEEKKDTTLYLDTKISCGKPLEIRKGGLLLLKLSDDSVMELNSVIASIGNTKNLHTVSGYTYSDYSVRPSFKITPSQLNDIISKGVKKVRIETSPEFYDKDFKKDKIGEVLATKKTVLLQTISKPKSIRGGF